MSFGLGLGTHLDMESDDRGGDVDVHGSAFAEHRNIDRAVAVFHDAGVHAVHFVAQD